MEKENFQKIIALLKENYIGKNQELKKITIAMEVIDAEKNLTYGILITLPSENSFFLESLRKV